MVAILVPMSFFASVVLIIYFFIRRSERKALIDKGINASAFIEKDDMKSWIRIGILLIGLSIGLFIGNVLEKYTALNDQVCYLSMLLFFGGISLIGGYFVTKSKENV